MKWKCKTHEFDNEAVVIADNLERGDNKYAIFGAGIIGANILPFVEKVGTVELFIDNNENKIHKQYMGREVISLDDYLKSIQRMNIIIAASQRNTPYIMKQLTNCGQVLNKDFYTSSDFIRYIAPVYMAYNRNEAFMELAQICVTERCTLKCKKCAHGCYAVPNDAEDMGVEEIKKNADAFFEVVDYIQEFVLIGGEPLLHKNIADCLEYIGEKYRDQMNIFSITTNGTIIPNEKTLEFCRKYNVLIRISNYSVSIPALRKQYIRLTDKLDGNDVMYSLQNEEQEWYDYGFDYVDDKLSEYELIKRFDQCRTPCRDIHEQKLYYCVMARTVADNLHYNMGKDDFLDLSVLSNENKSRILLEYNQGFSEKGYLDMCSRCNGKEAVNHIIPAAEQIKRK